jgi:hypothetical protein
VNDPTHGMLAEFSAPEALLAAVHRVRADGFTRFETFSPCPVEGLDECMLKKPSPIPGIMLGAAAVGAIGGFCLQWYAARDYPLDIGGRPVFSWPAFVPVSFELGVLTAVLTGIVSLLYITGLPRYDHPVFAATTFPRASNDRFFVYLRADDPRYSPLAARELLRSLNPDSIEEVSS